LSVDGHESFDEDRTAISARTCVNNGSWTSTSYLIGEIVAIPLTDYLSRVFSCRRYMLASSTLFAIFSVACAFTHDLPSMVAMRGVQGFAGVVGSPIVAFEASCFRSPECACSAAESQAAAIDVVQSMKSRRGIFGVGARITAVCLR